MTKSDFRCPSVAIQDERAGHHQNHGAGAGVGIDKQPPSQIRPLGVLCPLAAFGDPQRSTRALKQAFISFPKFLRNLAHPHTATSPILLRPHMTAMLYASDHGQQTPAFNEYRLGKCHNHAFMLVSRRQHLAYYF